MEKDTQILESAKQTIAIEADVIKQLAHYLDTDFPSAVKHIYQSKGRVIVTGVGKSANIATKIVATLNSTGTPAIFMHAADAIHGDLGIVQPNDTVLCISKSGNTPEIKVLVPLVKANKNTLVALTAERTSFLALQADYILHAATSKEACPHNLAPTSSTTAQLVLGDALAVALLELRGFTSKDFARVHPGGTLGKMLYLRVADIAENNTKPQVAPHTPLKDVLVSITEGMLGATAVLNNTKIVGVVTDGDLRRMLNKVNAFGNLTAQDIMTPSPKTVPHDMLAIEARKLMDAHKITQLLVEKDNAYYGMAHIHNFTKEGIL